MKAGARIAAFSSGPIKRGSGAKVMVVGVISKQGEVEGIVSGKITTDGGDSTRKILELIKNSRFRDQVKLIALNGVALAGLNVVDLKVIKSKGYEFVVLTRYRQRHSLLLKAIRLNKVKRAQKEKLVREQANIEQLKIGDFYTRASIKLPRPIVGELYKSLRLSHLISNGISTGESKGRI